MNKNENEKYEKTRDELDRQQRDARDARKLIESADKKKIRLGAFYGTNDWKKMRTIARKRDNDIDVWVYIRYGAIEHTGAAVHHIIPIADEWDKRLELDNLVTVSSSSHAEIERLYSMGGEYKTTCQRLLREAVRDLNYLAENDDIEDIYNDL